MEEPKYIEDVEDVTPQDVARFHALHERLMDARRAEYPEYIRQETSDGGFIYWDKSLRGQGHFKEDRYGNLMILQPSSSVFRSQSVYQITGVDKVRTLEYIKARIVADYEEKQVRAREAEATLKLKGWDELESRSWYE